MNNDITIDWRLCLTSVLCLLSCGSEQSELIYEEVVIQLPPTLELTTTVLQNTCAGASRQAVGASETVEIVQEGNDFSWIQSGTDADSVGLRFVGRVCPLSESDFELRMRSEAIVRVAEDDRFCRTTLRAPRAFGLCGDFDDLCNDPASIRLSWNECSGSFIGQFFVQLSYTEACVTVNDCALDLVMTAKVPSSSDSTCDAPQSIGRVPCDDGEGCTCEITD
jgi:hypothetical protein